MKLKNSKAAGKERSKGRKAGSAEALLGFCDLMCKYAETPKETGIDGSGSCRTFVALYCSAKKSLVHKNMPCRQKAMKSD